MKNLVRNILTDIAVELKDEFDRNFERQSFFSEAWERKAPNNLQGNPAKLRKSIDANIGVTGVTFTSYLPYAAIHNAGDDIVITDRMHRFFWAKYYETAGRIRYKKNGEKSQSRTSIRAGAEAEMWKAMALMKVGSKIHIPKRQFIGDSPEVQKAIKDIVADNIKEYLNAVSTAANERLKA
jgi:phage gpG-like protein